jgi:ABC-type phosphate transport system permease subunit
MVLAVVAAVLVGFLMYGLSYAICYLLAPDISNQVPAPTPTASITDLIVGSLLWVGLAALIAFTLVVVGLLINRIRNKNRYE